MSSNDATLPQQEFGDLSQRIIEHFTKNHWGVLERGAAITPETEIYHDLRMYGGDFHELVLWLNKDFGVETNVNFGGYGPPEINFAFVAPVVRRLLGRPKRRYRSLTIRGLAAIIHAGRWPS